jgi:hypothetical protein
VGLFVASSCHRQTKKDNAKENRQTNRIDQTFAWPRSVFRTNVSKNNQREFSTDCISVSKTSPSPLNEYLAFSSFRGGVQLQPVQNYSSSTCLEKGTIDVAFSTRGYEQPLQRHSPLPGLWRRFGSKGAFLPRSERAFCLRLFCYSKSLEREDKILARNEEASKEGRKKTSFSH